MLFGANNKFIVFTLIPLILSIGIIPAIPFSDAAESNQICIDKVWLENSKGKIACVTQDTADKLVERGWGTILSDDVFEEKPAMMRHMEGDEIDYNAELKLIPIHSGGVGPLTVTPILGEPTKQYPEIYIPGTEELDENEMRIFFCGTGLPFATYNQASACVVVQTGDGRSFLFDIGSGSIGRINSLKIPGNELTTVFEGHLHTDHISDIAPFWSQAYMAGRTVPIELYGPDGPSHEMGLEYFVEKFNEVWTWDISTRKGRLATSGQVIIPHQFDHTITQVIYDVDGFKVISFPAVHGEGAVAYRMQWHDMSVVYSSDSNVSKFLVENSQGADVIIMETFAPAQVYVDTMNWTVEMYNNSVAKYHSPAERTGLFMEVVEPKLAVMYHQIIDENVMPIVFEEFRKGYDGPAVFAQDLTVINLTPDYMVIRQSDLTSNNFPPLSEQMTTDEKADYEIAAWINEAALYEDDLREIIAKKNGN